MAYHHGFSPESLEEKVRQCGYGAVYHMLVAHGEEVRKLGLPPVRGASLTNLEHVNAFFFVLRNVDGLE